MDKLICENKYDRVTKLIALASVTVYSKTPSLSSEFLDVGITEILSWIILC